MNEEKEIENIKKLLKGISKQLLKLEKADLEYSETSKEYNELMLIEKRLEIERIAHRIQSKESIDKDVDKLYS